MARKRKRSNKTVAECGRRGRYRSVDGVEVVKRFWRYNLSWSTRNVAIHTPVLLLGLFTSHSCVAPTYVCFLWPRPRERLQVCHAKSWC